MTLEKAIEAEAHHVIETCMKGRECDFYDGLQILENSLLDSGLKFDGDWGEVVLKQAIQDCEVFYCENCGFYCAEHERSAEGTYCSDCEQDQEEEE